MLPHNKLILSMLNSFGHNMFKHGKQAGNQLIVYITTTFKHIYLKILAAWIKLTVRKNSNSCSLLCSSLIAVMQHFLWYTLHMSSSMNLLFFILVYKNNGRYVYDLNPLKMLKLVFKS